LSIVIRSEAKDFENVRLEKSQWQKELFFSAKIEWFFENASAF